MSYHHKEAFCVMRYRCEKCGELELLWNSRDGVTPSMLGCRKCEGVMQHIMRDLDTRPDFRPSSGMRIFVDLSIEHARAIAIKQVENFDGTEHEKSDPDEREELIRHLTEEFYHDGHAPSVREMP